MPYTSPLGGTITAADTAAHAFPTGPARALIIQTPAGNTGSITISDTAGIVGGNLTGGIVVLKGTGVTIPQLYIGPLQNLESLAYQAANANDVINFLVLR